jgi:hypothetical protein
LFLFWAASSIIVPVQVSALPLEGRQILSLRRIGNRIYPKSRSQHKGRDILSRLFMSSKDDGALFSRGGFVKIVTTLVALPAVVELYSRIGTVSTKFPNQPFPLPRNGSWEDVEHATLVFHGAGGQDKYTDELMKSLENKKELQYSSMVEWSDFSSNLFQSSFNGQRVGREAAERLLKQASNLKTVQLIGISVGAFAADAASTKIRDLSMTKENGERPFIQLTLLDPFCQRGIFDFGYGNRVFGRSADYAEQFLNTDDPVPSTNSPLANAVCYDVTYLRPSEIFGHDWPLVYYARSKRVGIVYRDNQLVPGAVIKLDR